MANTMEQTNVEKYSREELESFVDGILDASRTMKRVYEDIAVKTVKYGEEIESPFYLVNLHGSLPLFDILSIVDPSVDVDRAIYFPGSSRIQRSRDVLRYCFENFFWEKQDETNARTPVFSLDEVVGGHSVERVINSYNSAIN